jgi:integrase
MAKNRKRREPKDRVNLTPGRIDGFNCPAGLEADFLWDSTVPGLGIKANRGGRKIYIFQDRLPGLGKDGATGAFRMAIGPTGSITLDVARERAQNYAAAVAKGIDPRQEKKKQAEALAAARAEKVKEAVTLGDSWPKYIEANRKKWSARHLADHHAMVDPGGRKAKRRPKGTKIMPGPLSCFTNMKLSEITPDAVQSWLESETATRPTRARLAFALLRACLNWCADHPDYKDAVNTDACGRRVKRDHLPSANARDDCLQREQLKPWFAEVRKLDPVVSAYLQGLLLTGARRNELAPLKWSEIDFKWRSVTIHDKVDGERTIPLPPYLAALLYALPRRNDYVFSSPREKARLGYITEPRRAHNRALSAAGIEGLTIHGLRRSFGTLAEWVEVPAGISAQLMGHKPSALAEKHYRRRPLDLLRLWHTKIEAWILEQAGIEQPAEDEHLGKLRAVN